MYEKAPEPTEAQEDKEYQDYLNPSRKFPEWNEMMEDFVPSSMSDLILKLKEKYGGAYLNVSIGSLTEKDDTFTFYDLLIGEGNPEVYMLDTVEELEDKIYELLS
jgi:hypothetical protein